MKTMKKIVTATFAIAALAAPLAVCAADGDIFEIRRVDESGVAIAAPTEPLDGGDVARFAVRLAKPTSSGQMFRLVHTGLNTEAVDWLSNRPAIGIYVNGVFTLAYLETVKARNEFFTDFIFTYTVKPGDYAWPIHLAAADRSLVTDTVNPSSGYYLNFLDSTLGVSAWKVDDSTTSIPATRTANFWYGTPSYHPSAPESDGRHFDYDLSVCNFNVKTVDFDDKDESTSYWRTIHEHTTEAQPVGAVPSLEVSGVPTNSVTLYVWSENEGAVELIAGRDVSKVTSRNVEAKSPSSIVAMRKVGEIKIVAGKQSYEFNLRGVAKGNDAPIVMSAFPYYNYNDGTNAKITDYQTKTVRCVDPLPASVTIKPGKSVVTATSDYKTYVTELNVALSENPVGHDFTATIVPTNSAAGCPNEWWDYIRIASSTDADPALTTPTNYPRVLFSAGGKEPTSLTIPTALGDVTTPVIDGKIYLYALRSDEYVTGANSIIFSVETDDATASQPSASGGIDGWGTSRNPLTINAENPEVVSMFDGTDAVAAVANTACSLQIEVSDIYADMHSGPADGYAIYIKKNVSTDLEYTRLPGLYYPASGNILVLTNSTDKMPSVSYAETGDISSSLYVVSPYTGKKSVVHNFTATVTAPAGYTVETTSGDDEFYEGDQVQVKITLDKQNTLGDIYAYLKGDTTDDDAAVECTWRASSGGKGRKLANYATSLSSGCRFVMKDGDASKMGSQFSYTVVFLTEPNWTDDVSKRVTAFQAKNTLVFTVRNVIPRVDYVSVNNGNYEVFEQGETVGPFPINVPQTFRAIVPDDNTGEPGITDREATGADAFVTRWKFMPASGAPTTLLVPGDPDAAVTNFTFTAAGTYMVDVDLQDKDIAPRYGNRDPDPDDGYATTGLNKKFTFKVEVIDQPAMQIVSAGDEPVIEFYEDESADAGGSARMKLKLGLNECDFPMEVKLLIAPAATASTAPGTFTLMQTPSVRTNGVETLKGVDYETYIVTVPARAVEADLYIQTMDGTRTQDGTGDSSVNGFNVVVTNITTTVVPNSGNKRACDYYLGVSPIPVKVRNTDPKIDPEKDVTPKSTTNAIPVAIGTADAITWYFDDVTPDFTRGIEIKFTGDGGKWSTNVHSRAEAITVGAAGYRPVFTTSGTKTVTLTITDPDRGSQQIDWIYEVAKSKSMKLAAHGPTGGVLTKKYDAYSGLGKGRVWAKSNSDISVDTFVSSINCGLAKEIYVYGYGYKVGDKDDGSTLHYPDGFGGYLTPYYATRDTPLNQTGGNKGTAAAYEYVAPLDKNDNPVDSYLYAWLKNSDENGGGSSFGFLNDATSPEFVAVSGDSGTRVKLPSEAEEDGDYPETTLEAIFAIEYIASDNMGDINLDGIPDIYAEKYSLGSGGATEGGQTAANDKASVSASNDDADFLPTGASSSLGTLIPGLPDTWETSGRPFTAKLEIRGNGEALNDAPENNTYTKVANLRPDRVYDDPATNKLSTLDGYDGDMPVEYLAWLDYAAANGLEATNRVNWSKWSPERPTDPTLDDTDDDGLPDGYEYYIWYRAHVGYNDNGVHKYLTGRKYDPRNPAGFVFMPASEVEGLFDPAKANPALSEDHDSDNDGLPDLVEFAIGTNPVDFDSDGDGLPDGFEVLVAATDPLTTETTRGTNDAKRNYDGDAMAFTTPKAEKAMKEPPSKNVKSLSKFALVDANGDGDGVQWYVIPTDDVATNLDYAASGAGYIVKVDKVEYVTTNRPATVERDGGVFLAADLPLDSTWTTGSFIDTNGVNQLIQLMPTRIVAGTKLAAAPDMTTTNFGHVVYLTKVAGSMAAWTYGRGDSFGFLVPGRYKDAPEGTAIAAMPEVDDTIAYIHYYVYQEFGFDPRTAWKASSPLAKRWGDPDLLSYAGNPTRTRWYTLYDEFLTMTFFLNGLNDASVMNVTPTKSNPWHAIWSRYTTNGRGPDEPGLSNDEHYTGRTPINGSPDENGADTDADGVPDGWELYVMTGPKTTREVNGVEKEFFRILPPYDDNGAADLGPFVAQAKNNGATGKDGDDLSEYQEFAGTDTTAYYKDLSTTVDNPHGKWLNKFFPTDPWNADTDGDGITDKDESSKIGRRGEYHGFIYGTPVDNGKLISIPGGGLNPCSVDTDLDGLPDEWEMQYNGSKIYSGAGAEYAGSDAGTGNPLQGLVDGMDGTVPDAFNVVNGALDAASGAFKTTTLRRTYEDGTRRMFGYVDRDYDNDGLENWQEYIIGTMRCWRYDDPLTPWDSIPEAAYWDELGNFAPQYAALGIDTTAGDGGVGEFWYRTLVDVTSPLYNPRLVSGQTTGAMYFSRVTNPWDPASRVDKVSGECCSFYYFRGKVDGVSLASLWGSAYASITGRSAPPLPPAKYISCSPLRADTDGDGMDDYYELFHGMNPLLGASGAEQSFSGPCDIVSDAWLGAFEAWNAGNPAANAWTFRAARGDVAQGDYYKTGRKPRGTGYDFEYFPWLNGLATADPDGDDVRNQDESIMPKIGTTTWLHTDPTPLWMTDSGYSRSLTRMYFRMPGRDRGVPTPGDTFEFEGVTYRFSDFAGWTPGDGSPYFISYSQDQGWLMYGAGAMNWICSFEENEGYDSDHDAMSDSHEADGKLRSASDPQDANSPDRRQAMYFAGPANPSALQLPPEVAERYPVTGDIWPDEPAFLEFTVEAWVFAESLADATVVERAIWCDEAKAGDEEYVRKNFQLGVKGGKWFAKYDVNGTLARGEVKITSTADAEVGKWHHLAATYNGSRFVLYVDGEPAAPAVDSSRKPEYGGSAMVLRRTKSASGAYEKFSPGDYWYDDEYALTPIVVGASLKTKAEGGSADAFDVRNAKGWGFYDGFFTGYIDEVRIWDGARGVDDIRADYRARRHYTVEAAAENRSAFYTEWTAKGSRYGKDESGNSVSIVPELRYLFTFDSVPGGVDDQVTAKVPAGFDYYQPAMFGDPERGAAVLSRPEDWSVAWWTNVVAAYGSVYSSGSWVQWVPNTMAHLPRFDGTTLDSFYWSDNTCGDADGTYSFARTAEPASRWTQLSYNGVTNDGEYSAPGARHHLICRLDGIQSASTNSDDSAENEVRTYSRDRFNQFRFAGRNSLVDGLDLLPLGGAYPKAFPNTAEGGMWDEQGASTQSELTSDDANFNDLPDTWEEYARGNYSPESSRISWDTMVTWNGRRMTAGEAYRLDLAAGLVVAADAYGTLDVIQRDDLAQAADQDGSLTPDWWDDLYGIYGESGMADSDNDGLSNYAEYLVTTEQGIVLDPKNAMSDSKTLDYFRKVGSLYLGEMYADHDFIRDSWEDLYDVSFVNRNVYDAHSDPDGDGWSNYAESRAGSRPDKGSALVFEDVVGEYPVPSIRIKAVYSGVSTGATVVVKAYSGDILGAADAVWTVAPDGTASRQYRLLGMNNGDETTISLGPGSVVAGSVYVEFRDPNESTITGTKIVWTNPMDSEWRTGMSEMTIAGDSQHSRLGAGDAYTFGEVDYTKGTATIRLSAVPRYKYHDGNNNYTYNSELLNPSNTYVRVDTTRSYVRAVWESRYVPEDGGWSFVLSKADSGHVREGLNTFMVFCDTDGNGEYTVGEPLGIVRDVNVGWDATPEVFVQLTDEAVAGARFAVAAQSNATTRVRVVRTAVNGAACKPRAVYARTLDLRAGKTFTEVDLMKAGEWDFDWKNLVSDAAADGVADVASAEYTVYLGYGQTEPVATFTRTFGGSFVKPAPSGTYADSGYIVHSARPTLAWKASAGYPTFALQIAADADFNEVVYATTNLMPGVTAEGCRFTPDIYVGDGLLDGTNYFWRVAQLNSKFTMNVWSDVATFRTEVDSSKANTGYGKLAAEIRYYGPSTKAASNVVVGVYGSADFACEPVARMHLGLAGTVQGLTNDLSKAFTAVSTNVCFDGIAPGRYYVMAFIDSNTNGVRDAWESWGYANKVGYESADPYAPVSLEVTSSNAKIDSAYIIMEDTDVNQNKTPDCIEDMEGWTPPAAVEVATRTDSDGDGLTDAEEGNYLGTDPYDADTDGDGMPDGWEYWNGVTDALNADGEIVASGDVMAYAEERMTVIVLEDDTPYAITAAAAHTPAVGDSVAGLSLATVYRYGVGDNAVWAFGTNLTASVAGRIVSVEENVPVALMHAQVYARYGFDSRTCVPEGTVNTKEFTALDKYLVGAYFQAIGVTNVFQAAEFWENWTLKPGDPDNNRDGVPDGWELYLMFGTNTTVTSVYDMKVSPFPVVCGMNAYDYVRNDTAVDQAMDGDGLSIIREYNGGVSPTDPWLKDTNGDGIDDKTASEYGIRTPEVRYNDDDNDGLDNFTEYLVNEVFDLGITLSPTNSMSDGETPDYFRKVGLLYLGEMLTDHDHMEDWWEKASGGRADPSVWDAQLDPDQSGWSNYAVRRSMGDAASWIEVGTKTNFYFVTYGIVSADDEVFQATNTAQIVTTEFFDPNMGWLTNDVSGATTLVRYTLAVPEPIMVYGGHPKPVVDLTVYYNGKLLGEGKTMTLVVKAYSDDDMMVADAVFTNTVKRGVNKLTLHEPASGMLKEGRNHFMAYMVANSGDSSGGSGSKSGESSVGEYEPGQPFGVVRDVDVGWNSARAVIELSETSAVADRIKLWESEMSDRVVSFGLSQPTNKAAVTIPAAPNVRVRVLCVQIDDNHDASNLVDEDRIIMDRIFNAEARDYIHEGDFLGNGNLDIDWATFEEDVVSLRPYFANLMITNVAYAIVFGDGSVSRVWRSNDKEAKAHPLLITRRFEKTHTPPTAVIMNGDSVCRTAQPTFRWKIEGEDPWASAYGTTYTAFRVKVWDKTGGTEVYDSGYQRMPVADSTGVYSWTAPLYVDRPSPSGAHAVFSNLCNYTWSVFTYNAKFKTDDVGSVKQTFRMNVTDLDTTTYSIDVNVVYAGPASDFVNHDGSLHVQAFATPDFTGSPVAEATFTNATVEALSSASGAQAKIVGLKAGTYYLRAYIDTDYDWTFDDWESWGYLSERDVVSADGTASIFNPVSATVGPSVKGEPARTIYIEDRDTDGDGFPDAWEAERNGNVFDPGFIDPVEGDTEFIAVNTNLVATLTSLDVLSPDKKTLINQIFGSTSGAAYGIELLTGVKAGSAKRLAAGSFYVPASVAEESVAIRSLDIDRQSGEVVLRFGAETDVSGLDPTGAAAAASVYDVAYGAEVTVKVYRTETLAGEWQLVAEENMVITSSDGGQREVRAPLPQGVDAKSGFFKVEIEQ